MDEDAGTTVLDETEVVDEVPLVPKSAGEKGMLFFIKQFYTFFFFFLTFFFYIYSIEKNTTARATSTAPEVTTTPKAEPQAAGSGM